MSWEYRLLKRQLGIPQEPMLDLFERFCERAYDAMAAMEWSWKFAGQAIQSNRAFWLGAGGRRAETGRHFRWLAHELGFLAPDLPDGLSTWHRLLDTNTDRVLLGYSGDNPAGNQPACLKLYLTLESCPEDIYSELIRPLHAKLLPGTPPESARVILAHSINAQGISFSRAYLFCFQEACEDPIVRDYMSHLLGERALDVAMHHPSFGVALKNDTVDMIGFSFRPTGLDLQDHPSWRHSPVLTPLLHAAGRVPALRERLHRVSWVTVPLGIATSAFPFVLPEMNVYVKLLA